MVKRRLSLDALEDRLALSGAFAALANQPPAPMSTMLLLTDGDVLAQGGGVSSAWYELTPQNGSYVNGAWSTLASSLVAREYYGSAVLPSGNVLVLGGEFSSAGGDTNTGEIYSPSANTWTVIAPYPEPTFGDGSIEVLPSGLVLADDTQRGGNAYLYNPASNTWTQTGGKIGGSGSNEETFVKLPGGSILTYDVNANVGQSTDYAQVYNPATGTWYYTDPAPDLVSSYSEIGPAALLDTGSVLFLGATGLTGIYNPATNAWMTGPTIPNGDVADDSPLAVLPDGDVLFAADQSQYAPPTHFYEYSPVNNTLTTVGTPYATYQQQGADQTRMLLLPTGEVLLSDGLTPNLFTYSESGSSGYQAPVIVSVLPNEDGSFTLAGSGLNGGSEGASYGDDAQMATNYPLVMLTQGMTTVFATTYGWASNVATGSQVVSTQFTVPAGLAPGAYSLTVIADGISSVPVNFAWPAGPYLAGLEQSLDLQFTGSYYNASYDINADWLQSQNGSNAAHGGWYFILPDGNLHAWDGVQSSATGSSSAVVALMDASLWTSVVPLVTAGITPPAGLDLQYTGNWFTSYGGLGADWFQSGNGSNPAFGGWYFLTQQGNLYAWTGGTSGNLVASLDASYWWFPSLILG